MGIVNVTRGPDLSTIRRLFREYQAFLGVDLCFQSFEEELAGLPGRYGPPGGALLLARHGNSAAGCVALRSLGRGACEMKRMFVRPRFRGLGIGRALAEAIVERGRKLGYRTMKLDSVSRLETALGIYRTLGFKKTAPYCHNPLEGAIFLAKRLTPPTAVRRKTRHT
ncbi:MAG: GNAT family N-acetyltransferase [Planctomycetota bacterium]